MNRLPPEILSRIIRRVPHEQETDTRSIVMLTHVCRYWREFIVSTPWNWTLISSSRGMDLAALSLQRAKAAPLEICLNMGEVRETPGFCDLINPSIQNAKTLHFSGLITFEELTQTLPNSQSMPNLQSLTLTGSRYDRRNSPTDPFEQLPPTLRHLKLCYLPLFPSFLRLKALTELTLDNNYFNLHLDTLLDFLEENRSLENVTLNIEFTKRSRRHPRRGAATMDRLQHLSMPFHSREDVKALISNIVLRRGVHLEIDSIYFRTKLDEVLSGIPTTHLSNLQSPVFMEYRSHWGDVRLFGPNGSLSFRTAHAPHTPFVEFPLLPLTDIREFHLIHIQSSWKPPLELEALVFDPSLFPALETFAINCETSISHLLSTLFSNPSFPPALKTLAFLDCNLSEDFMEALTGFASNRKITASAPSCIALSSSVRKETSRVSL